MSLDNRTLVDRLNTTGPEQEDYDRMERIYARFPADRSFYGDPFITKLDGQWLICIESESGGGTWREISGAFAKAWIAEFGA